MKLSILLLMSAGFLMACSPNANFTADEARFQSLMDGNTVEIVDNQELIDSLDQPGATTGDNGDMGDNNTSTGDDGANTSNGDGGTRPMMPPIPGMGEREREGCENCTRKEEKETERRMTCRERLLRQQRERERACPECEEEENETRGEGRRRAEMLTSPEEIEGDEDMRRALRCGKKGHKVLVCHHPNNDFEKRKTLCVGAAALKAFVGSGDREGNFDRNFAGECQRDEDDEEESDEEEEEEEREEREEEGDE